MQMPKPAAALFLLNVTSENTVRTGDQSWAEVQLCVEDLSVSFSWQGDVNIISSAVTMEPSVQRRRRMGRLERT